MSATLDSTGLTIQTNAEILADVIADLQAAFGSNVRTELQSSFGQLARIWAELEAFEQEALLSVFHTFDLNAAEGVSLDRLVALLGMTRIPELQSQVTGTATGTPATNIPNGTRIQFDDDETVWLVVDGPYTIGGGGTVSITVEAEDTGALEPGVSADWTILDVVTGFSDVGSFASTAQPIVGRETETDTELRVRADTARYARGQGPNAAIEAAVLEVTGVTYVRCYENVTWITDANGIPGKSINVVVEGGADDEVAQAIWNAKPLGSGSHGTDVVDEPVVDSRGEAQAVSFDRVADVTIWIDATITTSTSEETPPDDLATLVADTLVEAGEDRFGIGDDVLPLRLAAALGDIPGIDAADVQISIDDGAADPYSTAKRVISIRERATFATARITVTED